MKKLTLVSTLIMSGLLVACGGSDPSNKPDTLFPEGFVPAPPPVAGSDEGIVNTPLPLFENFNDAVDIGSFFSATYKSLATDNPDDPAPSFYYPTCCLYDDDGNVQENSFWISETEDKKLRFGNARFTIGQTLSALAGEASDPKINTTSALVTDSWGELDLSRPYKISFCVVQTGGAENMLIFVDNNTSSEANSKWGGGTGGSPIFKQNVNSLLPGKRVTISVPGETRFSPESASVLTINNQVGEKNSFLQVRVGSGGYAIIDDFLIEYQDESSIEPAAETCVADPNLQAPPPKTAPAAPATPRLIVGDSQLTVTWSAVSGAANYEVYYNTTDSSQDAIAFSGNPVQGTSAVLADLVNDTPYYVFVRAVNAIGVSAFSESSSATPVAPTVFDTDYTWGFNPVAYQDKAGFFTTTYDAGGNNAVDASTVVHEVDGLLIFLSNGTALRYRGNDDRWNFNGHSWAGGSGVTVPAVGVDAPDLRAFVGVPVDSGRAFTLTVNYQQSSSSVTSGKIVLIGSDNKVLGSKDALSGSDVITFSADSDHTLSHVKIVYSREGASGGGIHIGDVIKTYTEVANPAAEDRVWGFDVAAYLQADTDLFETPFDINASDNKIKAMGDVGGVPAPAVEVEGLRFYSSSAGTLRFRASVPAWNTNGSSFTDNATALPVVGGDVPTNVRSYIEIPVVSGEAVDISITYRQTSSTATSGQLAFVGSDNKLLAAQDADFARVGMTLGLSLTAGHTQEYVRILYSREGITSGGVNITEIRREYPN